MNTFYLCLSSIGFALVALSCMKILEYGPKVGFTYTQVGKLALAFVIFMMLFSIIDLWSWGKAPRPIGSAAVFTIGAFSIWRVFVLKVAPEADLAHRLGAALWHGHSRRNPPLL